MQEVNPDVQVVNLDDIKRPKKSDERFLLNGNFPIDSSGVFPLPK
jgi:hypothetical protein